MSLSREEREKIWEDRKKNIADRKLYIQAVKECRLKRRCLKKEMAWFRRKMRKKAYAKTEKGRAIRKAIKKRWEKTEKGIIAKRNKNKSPSHKALNALRKAKNRALEKAMTDFDKFVFKQAFHLRKQREQLFGTSWHIDHIIPVSKGGTNEYTNFQVVPAKWNIDKSNLHTNKFFGEPYEENR